MKQMMRKLFALLMVAMMLCSSLPTDALADALPEQTPAQGEAQDASSEGEGEPEPITEYDEGNQPGLMLLSALADRVSLADALQNGYTLNGGNYYVDEDLNLENTIQITGKVSIDLREDATITKNDSGRLFLIKNAGNLTLSGEGTLDHTEKDGDVIYLESNNRILTLNGPTLKGGSGSGVHVNGEGSTFNMESGKITGAGDSGIRAEWRTIVNVSGGEIYGNSSTNGGGVYVGWEATVNISGVEIHNNYSTGDGGGVCAINGTMNLSGGTISNNTSKHLGSGDLWGQYGGGGIYVTGALYMSGGEVSHNTADAGGGIFVNGSDRLRYEWRHRLREYCEECRGRRHPHRYKCEREFNQGGKWEKIYITGNKTLTPGDWGGGGIFVSEPSKLIIYNAKITDNTAGRLRRRLFHRRQHHHGHRRRGNLRQHRQRRKPLRRAKREG